MFHINPIGISMDSEQDMTWLVWVRDFNVRVLMMAVIAAAVVPFVVGFWFQLCARAFSRGREEFERMDDYVDSVSETWSVTPLDKS